MQQTITRTYKGNHAEALARFRKDAASLAAKGYHPISENWVPGTWGCGSFIIALLLCFILIGILVFIYMLIVKPPGTLTVTYSLSESAGKVKCPTCAELVQPEATKCRFCGAELTPQQADAAPRLPAVKTPQTGMEKIKKGLLIGLVLFIAVPIAVVIMSELFGK